MLGEDACLPDTPLTPYLFSLTSYFSLRQLVGLAEEVGVGEVDVALHPRHGGDDAEDGFLVGPLQIGVGAHVGAFGHDADVRLGVVAVLGRCPAVDDLPQGAESVEEEVGAQDTECGSQAEEVALELDELSVQLPWFLPHPACAFTPADVQWVVVSLSSCHSVGLGF